MYGFVLCVYICLCFYLDFSRFCPMGEQRYKPTILVWGIGFEYIKLFTVMERWNKKSILLFFMWYISLFIRLPLANILSTGASSGDINRQHIDFVTPKVYFIEFSGKKIPLAPRRCGCHLGIVLFKTHITWWRHRMETLSALLALCARNSPVTGEFP